jgi:hypothetical protein
VIVAVGLILWPPTAKALAPSAINEMSDGQIRVDSEKLVQRLFDPQYVRVVQQSLRDGTFSLDVRRTVPSSSLQSAAEEFLTIWYTRHQNISTLARNKFGVYGVSTQESTGARGRTSATRAASHYSPLYLVIVGNRLNLPHRNSLGYVTLPTSQDHTVKPHLHAPFMPASIRLLTPIMYMLWGILLVPFLGLFVFFDVSSANTGSLWTRLETWIVANLQFAVVFAVIGAVGGFLTGVFVAIRGWRRP